MHQTVPVTLVFNVNYSNWCISNFAKFLVSWQVYIYIAEVDDDGVEKTFRVNGRNFLNPQVRMIFCGMVVVNYLYLASRSSTV